MHIDLFKSVELCPLMAVVMYEKPSDIVSPVYCHVYMPTHKRIHSSRPLSPSINLFPVSCLPSLLSPLSLSLTLPSFVFSQEHKESSGGVDGRV